MGNVPTVPEGITVEIPDSRPSQGSVTQVCVGNQSIFTVTSKVSLQITEKNLYAEKLIVVYLI